MWPRARSRNFTMAYSDSRTKSVGGARISISEVNDRQHRRAPLPQRGPQLIGADARHHSGILLRHPIQRHRPGPRDQAHPARVLQQVAQKQMGDTLMVGGLLLAIFREELFNLLFDFFRGLFRTPAEYYV